jgi:hypothetical protein
MTKPAPLPLAGQIAPNMYADLVRWSRGARGLVPRLAHRRVICKRVGNPPLLILRNSRLYGADSG